VRTITNVYCFGPFQLDSTRRRLLRGTDPVLLPDRHLEILLQLTANAGRTLSKDELIEAAWKDVAVADNSIEQAISSLRKALGTQPDGAPYIETLARRGYRFSAEVARGRPRQSDASLDALLAPYRAFVEGRAALETLDRDAVTRARQAFAQALSAEPDYPAAHVGMANACALCFESTRVHQSPDVEALRDAEHHAREACRLDPSSGEAWSTLAFVLHRTGSGAEAIAAARKAVTLDGGNWHHHLRLAFVSWGEERLRAAHRVLALCPGLALAHWFAATVFVARQAFDAALEALREGCASQDAQRTEAGRFKAVGLIFCTAWCWRRRETKRMRSSNSHASSSSKVTVSCMRGSAPRTRGTPSARFISGVVVVTKRMPHFVKPRTGCQAIHWRPWCAAWSHEPGSQTASTPRCSKPPRWFWKRNTKTRRGYARRRWRVQIRARLDGSCRWSRC
jgi:DNA-binding winged helix-turn-helix (wHTH) protein